MASLTIYLDSETLKAVEAAAKRDGSSISSWARHLLSEAAKPKPGWPEGYFEMIDNFDETTIEEPADGLLPLDSIELDEETR